MYFIFYHKIDYVDIRFVKNLFFLIVLSLCWVSIASSWGSTGHKIINLKAVIHLPDSMAAFRVDSLFFQSHASDADTRKVNGDTSLFNEAQRHFMDIDWYPNFLSLPHALDSVIALYGRTTVIDQGTNPWATVMVFDSLVAQLRRGDMSDALLSMSDLGHYVGDGHQPLHCTDNYDGGNTGNNGIHSRYEASMLGTYKSLIAVHPEAVQYIASPIDFIFSYIEHSQTFVDSIMLADTYAKAVSGWSGSGSAPAAYYAALWEKCGAFTIDQIQSATVDIASLWYTAWEIANTHVAGRSNIVASAFGGGVIAPSGTVTVERGRDTVFAFSPQTGHHIDSVRVDEGRVDSTASYTFRNVISDHTINAWFGLNQYIVTATAGPNGSIDVSGAVSVGYGADQAFSFTPRTGYHVDSLIVDDSTMPPASSYLFTNVTAGHTLRVTFAINRYTVTSFAGVHGSISPSGAVPVVYGDSILFHITPDSGYHPDSILVDGVYAGSGTIYTFKNIDTMHTISVTFTDRIVTNWAVADRWNLISVPATVEDLRVSVLFPTAVSPAFAYHSLYAQTDTLRNGEGYWMKFSGPQMIRAAGRVRDIDTVSVAEGWCLIGSISSPILVSSITSVPAGMVTSEFFAYRGGYGVADTIEPGQAYWVKVNRSGRLILRSGGAVVLSGRIQVLKGEELPPAPPGETARGAELPKEYSLKSAYPNPFNPSTTIGFDLPVASRVTITIYDLLGKVVDVVKDGVEPAGSRSLTWDASGIASGVYLYRLVASGISDPARTFTQVKKIVLVR